MKASDVVISAAVGVTAALSISAVLVLFAVQDVKKNGVTLKIPGLGAAIPIGGDGADNVQLPPSAVTVLNVAPMAILIGGIGFAGFTALLLARGR